MLRLNDTKGRDEDRVSHARNRGESAIVTPT